MKRKTLLLLLIMAVIGNYAIAQNTKTKQQIKQEKKEKELKEWHKLKKFIEDKDFVFTGSLLDGKAVDQKINFIYVNGKNATIQFASGFGGGPNGIGGITLEGEITKFNVKAKKEGKAITVLFTVSPKLGQGARGPITINISAYSFYSAYVGINSYTGAMEGEIKQKANSKIFEGNKLN